MSLSNSNAYLLIPPSWNVKLTSIDHSLMVRAFHACTYMRLNRSITWWCLIFWDRVWKIFSTSAAASSLWRPYWCSSTSSFTVLNTFIPRVSSIETSSRRISWWVWGSMGIRFMWQIWASPQNPMLPRWTLIPLAPGTQTWLARHDLPASTVIWVWVSPTSLVGNWWVKYENSSNIYLSKEQSRLLWDLWLTSLRFWTICVPTFHALLPFGASSRMRLSPLPSYLTPFLQSLTPSEKRIYNRMAGSMS